MSKPRSPRGKPAASEAKPGPFRGRGQSLREADAISQAILKSALELFSVHGYGGASIADIARASSVSSALIHYYFKSKDALWRAAVEDGLGNMVRDLKQIMADLEGVDSLARLKFFVRRYVSILFERATVMRVMNRETDTGGERLEWLRGVYFEPVIGLFREEVEAAQRDGKFTNNIPSMEICQIIAGACYHFVINGERLNEMFHIESPGNQSRERHAATLIDAMFNGLVHKEARSGTDVKLVGQSGQRAATRSAQAG